MSSRERRVLAPRCPGGPPPTTRRPPWPLTLHRLLYERVQSLLKVVAIGRGGERRRRGDRGGGWQQRAVPRCALDGSPRVRGNANGSDGGEGGEVG